MPAPGIRDHSFFFRFFHMFVMKSSYSYSTITIFISKSQTLPSKSHKAMPASSQTLTHNERDRYTGNDRSSSLLYDCQEDQVSSSSENHHRDFHQDSHREDNGANLQCGSKKTRKTKNKKSNRRHSNSTTKQHHKKDMTIMERRSKDLESPSTRTSSSDDYDDHHQVDEYHDNDYGEDYCKNNPVEDFTDDGNHRHSEEDNYHQEEQKNPNRDYVLFCFLAIVVVIAIVCVAFLRNTNSSGNSNKQKKHQTPIDEIIEILYSEKVSFISDLSTPGTSQNRAATFVSRQVPSSGLRLKNNQDMIQRYIERYVLAVLYYHFEGTTWNYELNFLSQSDHCNWWAEFATPRGQKSREGVLCNADGYVIGLNLGKFPSAVNGKWMFRVFSLYEHL